MQETNAHYQTWQRQATTHIIINKIYPHWRNHIVQPMWVLISVITAYLITFFPFCM